MNKILVGLVIVVVVVLGFAFYFGGASKSSGNVISEDKNTNTDSSGVKVLVIDSAHLRFFMNGVENPTLTVKEGDKVRVEFTSSEGFHDWKIDEFNAATAKIMAGNSSSVEFVVDKKGTFKYYCSVGKHRANGMEGTFIVE